MLSTGRVDLENLGFVPGLTNVNFNPGSSPEHEKVSLVLENTCLAADLLMRLPDETSERLRHDVNENQKNNHSWVLVGTLIWVPGSLITDLSF